MELEDLGQRDLIHGGVDTERMQRAVPITVGGAGSLRVGVSQQPDRAMLITLALALALSLSLALAPALNMYPHLRVGVGQQPDRAMVGAAGGT